MIISYQHTQFHFLISTYLRLSQHFSIQIGVFNYFYSDSFQLVNFGIIHSEKITFF